MQIVAEHLRERATTLAVPREQELFARSAFNRYYYAVFLTIRATLATFERGWEKAPHKEFPELLRNRLPKVFAEATRQRKVKSILRDGEATQLISRMRAAGSELADLVDTARKVRVAADYGADDVLRIENGSMKINFVSLDTARNWMGRVEQNLKEILKLWRQLGR